MIDYLTTLGPLTVFGLISAAISIFAYVPYIVDIFRRRTYPQRASWFIWSVLGSVAFASQLFEGATQSLWFSGAQLGGTLIVLLLSVTYGFGNLVNRLDFAVLLLAGCGLAMWYLTDTAIYALSLTIAVGSLGGLMTVFKAYAAPHTETLSTWSLSLAASVFAILSVGKFDPVLLAYPIYLMTLNGAIVLAVTLGQRRVRNSDFA